LNELVKILLVILLSSVKFVAGPAFAYYDSRYDFGFFETILYCVSGGMLGVFVFTFFSPYILMAWKKIFSFIRFGLRKKKDTFSKPITDANSDIEVTYTYITKAEEKKVFTKRNRRLVKIWQKYGLAGIAIITPVILSIPIGTVVANSLVEKRRKIFLYMLISITFWSVLMVTLFELYDVFTLKSLQENLFE